MVRNGFRKASNTVPERLSLGQVKGHEEKFVPHRRLDAGVAG